MMMMTTTKLIIIVGKRQNIETAAGQGMNHGALIVDMLKTTDRDHGDQTRTDTNGQVTLTTERSHGLKNDRERRGRGHDRQKVIDTISHIIITSRHQQPRSRHTHIIALDITDSMHHTTMAITRRRDVEWAGNRVIVTRNGLVRSRVTGTGLDPRRGSLSGCHSDQSSVDSCAFSPICLISAMNMSIC